MFDLIFAAGLCYAIDGDTLDCRGTRIRLWGIDTPERREAGFWPARRALALLIDQSRIECIVKSRDKYDRVVAQCYAGNIDLQCEQLRLGYAVEWLRYSHNYYQKCSQGRVKP